MPIRGLKGGVLKFLKGDDLDAIHYATLEVLSEVGVKMEFKPALEMFHAHGANVESIGPLFCGRTFPPQQSRKATPEIGRVAPHQGIIRRE